MCGLKVGISVTPRGAFNFLSFSVSTTRVSPITMIARSIGPVPQLKIAHTRRLISTIEWSLGHRVSLGKEYAERKMKNCSLPRLWEAGCPSTRIRALRRICSAVTRTLVNFSNGSTRSDESRWWFHAAHTSNSHSICVPRETGRDSRQYANASTRHFSM